MKAIGPTFSNELQAAGLGGLPFSWGADGSFQFDQRLSQAQIDGINAVYLAHDPTKQLPDVAGFINDCKAAVGGISALVTSQPLATLAQMLEAALMQALFSDAQTILIAAKTGSIITNAQYNAIKSAAATRNIPVAL